MDTKIIDKRVVARNINKGLLTKAEYDKHVKELPDLTDACEEVSETLFGSSDDEADADDESSSEATGEVPAEA